MDLKALIAKMDHIESKQILSEGFPTVADAKARADKEKTTGKFDKKEIKPGVTQYTRKSSTFDDGGKDSDQKKAEKKKKNEGIDFQSSIAQMLLKEFGLEERVGVPAVANPYQGADAAKFAAMSPADQAWLTKDGGKPDINDEFILARAPNKGKVGAAPSRVAPTPAPAPAPAADAGQAAQPATTAAAPATSYDSFGNPAAAGSAAATSADPTGLAQTQLDVNKDQAAPAAPAEKKKIMAPVDPGTAGLQKWIASKGYPLGRFGADGRWGKDTQKAIDAFWADWKAGKISEPDKQEYQKLLSATKDTDWTRYWFQKQKGGAAGQAAQPAAAAAPATAAAAPASQLGKPGAPKTIADFDAAIRASGNKVTQVATVKPNSPELKAAQDELMALVQQKAKLMQSAGGQAAQPAAPAKTFAQDTAARKAAQPGALGSGQFQIQSVQNEDDAILERIRTALFR